MSEAEQAYDVLVVGGGINGVGIARDAAGRGLRVLLCERGDLGEHTSSRSSKLIHGGLRYLEHYQFRLVREALREREVLLAAAPHIIRPMRFVVPHDRGLRPAWVIRLGLLLYDHLGGRERLPPSAGIDLRGDPAGAPLAASFRKGFVYSDCWVDDARLVVLSALDARERGAAIATRTELVEASREGGLWSARLRSMLDGNEWRVRARALVNAAGPWVDEVLERRLAVRRPYAIRRVAGSHMVVPKVFEHDHAYLFQAADRRVVFAIPYERHYTLIGTTERELDGDPAAVAVAREEIEYLCAAVNRYFRRQVSPGEAVWSYAGVRALVDDRARSASAVTREYVLDLDAGAGRAPLVSVFGGKITTYRRLAERALELLRGPLGIDRGPWTAGTVLPGGDLPGADLEAFVVELAREHPWLPAALARRYALAYGTRVERLLGGARDLRGLGRALADGLHEAEVDYVLREEWALTAEDILWRRTKLGLHLARESAQALDAWLERDRARSTA